MRLSMVEYCYAALPLNYKKTYKRSKRKYKT